MCKSYCIKEKCSVLTKSQNFKNEDEIKQSLGNVAAFKLKCSTLNLEFIVHSYTLPCCLVVCQFCDTLFWVKQGMKAVLAMVNHILLFLAHSRYLHPLLLMNCWCHPHHCGNTGFIFKLIRLGNVSKYIVIPRSCQR
jgi:hypothetical protein